MAWRWATRGSTTCSSKRPDGETPDRLARLRDVRRPRADVSPNVTVHPLDDLRERDQVNASLPGEDLTPDQRRSIIAGCETRVREGLKTPSTARVDRIWRYPVPTLIDA